MRTKTVSGAILRKEAYTKATARLSILFQSGRSKMNIPKILTPKAMTAYLSADDTVRQGLEIMKRYKEMKDIERTLARERGDRVIT